ncbi:hypothetical protein, partial [Salmonella enterica]|uniref:hypothetical protein n=1 Tax=Salmonella enterica TaxID=28901 RepID=UPI003D2D6579
GRAIDDQRVMAAAAFDAGNGRHGLRAKRLRPDQASTRCCQRTGTIRSTDHRLSPDLPDDPQAIV